MTLLLTILAIASFAAGLAVGFWVAWGWTSYRTWEPFETPQRRATDSWIEAGANRG